MADALGALVPIVTESLRDLSGTQMQASRSAYSTRLTLQELSERLLDSYRNTNIALERRLRERRVPRQRRTAWEAAEQLVLLKLASS